MRTGEIAERDKEAQPVLGLDSLSSTVGQKELRFYVEGVTFLPKDSISRDISRVSKTKGTVRREGSLSANKEQSWALLSWTENTRVSMRRSISLNQVWGQGGTCTAGKHTSDSPGNMDQRSLYENQVRDSIGVP